MSSYVTEIQSSFHPYSPKTTTKGHVIHVHVQSMVAERKGDVEAWGHSLEIAFTDLKCGLSTRLQCATDGSQCSLVNQVHLPNHVAKGRFTLLLARCFGAKHTESKNTESFFFRPCKT